jgi:hypothetical protein
VVLNLSNGVIFIAWYLVEHRDNFTLTFYLGYIILFGLLIIIIIFIISGVALGYGLDDREFDSR